ncbi:hypothetical protein OH77DRAFT_60276 [Trametes cingulata]|nr:hypothetical protein OH77DRAFT_60276 [Trametes cingulata]
MAAGERPASSTACALRMGGRSVIVKNALAWIIPKRESEEKHPHDRDRAGCYRGDRGAAHCAQLDAYAILVPGERTGRRRMGDSRTWCMEAKAECPRCPLVVGPIQFRPHDHEGWQGKKNADASVITRSAIQDLCALRAPGQEEEKQASDSRVYRQRSREASRKSM